MTDKKECEMPEKSGEEFDQAKESRIDALGNDARRAGDDPDDRSSSEFDGFRGNSSLF